MSRHRNIRTMDYNDEYDGYDDVYGRSMDEDHSSMSPSDAQQFMYDRNRQHNVNAFMKEQPDIGEESDDGSGNRSSRRRLTSEDFQMPALGDGEQARLLSCMEEIRNVVGESVSDNRLRQTVLECEFDCARALDAVLNLAVSSATESYERPSASKKATRTDRSTDANPKSLSDLIKLRSMPTPSAPFALPKMGVSFKAADTKTASFTKLSELTKYHLNKPSHHIVPSEPQLMTFPLNIPPFNIAGTKTSSSSNSSQPFVIPKLSSSPLFGKTPPQSAPIRSVDSDKDGGMTPHEMSLRKIMDLKKIRISDEPVPGPVVVVQKSPPVKIVDLSSALRRDSAIPIGRKRNDSSLTDDRPMLDQDDGHHATEEPLSMSDLLTDIMTADCLIDMSDIRRLKLANKTAARSKIGNILCSRYKNRATRLSAVRHSFGAPRHTIQRYAFEKPSPDDIVLKQLQKWK